MTLIYLLISSYLLGSIPTAYLVARFCKGIDIRTVGSGNVGATNAFRVLGKPLGVFVLLFDILKGFFVTAILTLFVDAAAISVSMDLARISAGILAIAGHNWPIFLKFKGGKGVATSLGVLSGLAVVTPGLRLVLGLCVLVWLIVFLGFGYVSLASIICALAFPASMFFFNNSVVLRIFSVVVAFIAIFRHKSNIRRLLEKKEHRVKFPWLSR
jgi:glycerol-3-phosphate acyltransferase PlsY